MADETKPVETEDKQTQADIRINNNKLRIIAYLEQGLFFKDACIRTGIDESTGHKYKRGDASFASQVEAGISKYKEKLIKCVNDGALKDAKIAIEVLKIRFPDEWNPVKKIQVVDPQQEIKRIKDLIYGTEGKDITAEGTDSQDSES